MSEDKSLSLLSIIAGEIVLGKIRLNPHMTEPRYLQQVRLVLMQFRRALGGAGYAQLSVELRPALHALADLLFDEVTTTSPRQKTVEILKKLPVEHRLIVENLASALTGKLNPRQDRWMNELWELKQYVDRVCMLSISGISHLEIREGFNEVLHDVVDALYDRRATLTN